MRRTIVTAVLVLVATAAVALATARPAHAESIADAIRARLEPSLPAGFGVAEIYVPPALAHLDIAPSSITVEAPRDLRAGRPSIKIRVRGRVAYVPVTIAHVVAVAVMRAALPIGSVITDADVVIEHRAVGDDAATEVVGGTLTRDLEAGATIGAQDVSLPAPLPRGTDVSVDVRRGGLRIRGTGVLELAARFGEPATVRLLATKTLLHGILVAPATVVIGAAP